MPKDNNQQPIISTTNSGDDQFPVFVEETLPPMPQGTPTTPDVPPAPEKKDLTPTETPITTSGSAAPQDDAIMPPTVTSKNKKKFAGGKVIATILGLFLLVGGVGAGVLLVNQNQNISEKAATGLQNGRACDLDSECASNYCDPNESICRSKITPVCSGNSDCNIPYTASGAIYCNLLGYTTNTYCCPDSKPVWNGNICTTIMPVNECEAMGGTCRRNSCNTDENQISQTCVEGSQNICCKTKATTVDCNQIKCTDTNCTVANLYPTCYVNHYKCNNNTDADKGCSEIVVASGKQTASYTGKNCGIEQIDIFCTACGMEGYNSNPTYGTDYISKTYPINCDETTTDNSTASCSNIKVYTESWSLIEEANLSSLSVGDNIKFCVNGVSSSGSFDMARITANGTSLGETREKRSGTNDFCSSYTIPAGTTTFNITSQIHHVDWGWR